MECTDKIITCVDCSENFVFSAGEQVFFVEKRFKHEPKHCRKCRATRNNLLAAVQTRVICARCGELTSIPFRPRTGRPVLCRPCFQRPELMGRQSLLWRELQVCER